jgi:hypothetical protein
VIISTIESRPWGGFYVVDVRHVPDRPLTRDERTRRKHLTCWLEGIRFDKRKAQLLAIAERVGAAR